MARSRPGPVLPERYVKALAGRDPIAAQRKAPDRVAKLIRGLSEQVLRARPAPGKWSIREVIGHLADGEVILGSRMRFVAAMERPPLPGYDQDAFVARLGLEKRTARELLEAFRAARALNVDLLTRLPKSSFERVGLHAERGEESIAKMVAMYAGHDFIHEDQIARLRAQLAAPGKGRGRSSPQRAAPRARGR